MTTLGMHYGSRENYLSRLNTVTKLTITLFFSVLIVFMKTETGLLILFGASLLYVAPLRRWKIMLLGYALLLVMFGMSLLFSHLMGLLAESFGAEGNFQLLVPFLRVSFMINLVIALTMSSGVRRLTNVLKTVRMPRFLFLPLIVVFRFVPSFINEIRQIHRSIRLKVGNPNFFMMITRPRLFIRLMVMPAVIRALRSAEELSAAAELKGISGSDRVVNSTPESWTWRDGLAYGLAAALTVAAIHFNAGTAA
jgi:energy-coupling factor transport system permease protein